eukprot:GFYU01015214.1.p1 GENE.GFYU01015214.1~~GFYU01015214.1.p1  ORF type:complete len:160 (+),score=36.28 GFYU01015214.1:2-481(+)
MGDYNITEFSYRFGAASIARVFLGVQVKDRDAAWELQTKFETDDFIMVDLTENELAKSHVRNMVGGRAAVRDEVLYRFEFPERPGALIRFLEVMGGRWNISLFHYRNVGANSGRVLMGMQVPPVERSSFSKFLNDVGYEYTEETNNKAYHLFCHGHRNV